MTFVFPPFRRYLTACKTVFVATLLAIGVGAGAPAYSQEAPNPALWSISDDDSTLYLFGTIHILNPSLKWKTTKVENALAAAETVYFEAPADTSNPAATQQLVMKYGLNPPGVTLSGQLSEEGKALFQKILTQYGMGGAAANFEQFRPWLVGITLASVQIQAQGGQAEAGVEKIIQGMLEGTNKNIAYFETDEQQLQYLSGMSKESELLFLEEGMRSMLEEPDVLNDMIQFWLKGETKELGELMHSALSAAPEVYDTLLVGRNKNWADEIDALMEGSGTIFVAVGAGHLAGEDSVQSLLTEKGYTVKRH